MKRQTAFVVTLWLVLSLAQQVKAAKKYQFTGRVFAGQIRLTNMAVLNGIVSSTVILQSGEHYIKLVLDGFEYDAISKYMSGDQVLTVEVVRKKKCDEQPRFWKEKNDVGIVSDGRLESEGYYVLSEYFRDHPIPTFTGLECYDTLRAAGHKGHFPIL